MKANVLIVDDDEALRAGALRPHPLLGPRRDGGRGRRDGAGRDVAEGVRSHPARSFDAGMTGLDLLEKLRESGCSAEKVVLTAFGSVAQAVEAMKQGADDFLTKPRTSTSSSGPSNARSNAGGCCARQRAGGARRGRRGADRRALGGDEAAARDGGAGGALRRDPSPHRRERDRQAGPRGARPPVERARGGAVRLHQLRRDLDELIESTLFGTRRARSRAPSHARTAAWRRPPAAPRSSMRWAM